jgi:lysozyme family protein
MKTDFELALEFTLKWEGGFVHHPKDPGGPTNKGVTQKTYDDWRLRECKPLQSVAKMTDEECRDIYWFHYWSAVDGVTRVEWQLFRIVFFDTVVQFGVRGANYLWQGAMGIKADGIWGPVTADTTRNYLSGRGDLRSALALVGARIRYRGKRVKENFTQHVFLNGWLNRDTDLMAYVLDLQ